ncbi:MAG TPA: GDP-L-fucose synthase [Thermoanaerobaculia bacterium]
MKPESRIFVAGHRGLVGSAIIRKLQAEGHSAIITRTRDELDLLDLRAVDKFFATERIEYAFVAAATVGGIHANATQLTRFLYENMLLAMHVIHAAAEHNVSKLLFLGSSCIYPREAPQPLREDYLLTGPLEPTNEAYAIAKIAGLKLCEYYFREQGRPFISAMPTNLYGPNDNFDALGSHVIPGLMRRFHEAKMQHADEVKVWGSGTPRREFLHVDDLADALYLMMQRYEQPQFLNVGAGEDCTIAELAERIADTVGYQGRIVYDASKPDGTPRKLLDVTRIHDLGWSHRISLRDGLRATYAWALENRVFN